MASKRHYKIFFILFLFLLISMPGTISFFKNKLGDVKQPLAKLGYVSEFTLTNYTNEEFKSSSLKGSWWLANFFFATCEGPCPLLMARMKEIHELEIPNLYQVSISVDPETDTNEILTDYSQRMSANPERWFFLTGEMDQIMDVGKNKFKVMTDTDKNMHSTRIILVDPEGNIRGYYEAMDNDAFEKLKQTVKSLN